MVRLPSRALVWLPLLLACSAPRPSPRPALAPPAPRAPSAAETAERVRSLYEAGVSAYAAGDMAAAAAKFEEVLKLDPAHAPAARGLRRIRMERGAP